jgi:hypothetical protein
LTPVKALKARIALRMRTSTDDAAWIARYQAAMERLKSTGSSIQGDASVEEAVGAGEATRRPELVEAAPSASELGRFGGNGREQGLTVGTLEAIEAIEAATSARDARQADVVETRNVEETPRDAGQEEELSEPQEEREQPRWQPQ